VPRLEFETLVANAIPSEWSQNLAAAGRHGAKSFAHLPDRVRDNRQGGPFLSRMDEADAKPDRIDQKNRATIRDINP